MTDILHMTHWGVCSITTDNGEIEKVEPWPEDPEPSPLMHNIESSYRHETRVDSPYIRKGWLEDGPGPTERRGHDPFVQVDWDEAERHVARELRRVYEKHGPASVYGGSYGWGSAGRFHHAQSQVHRFLNCLGGYVASTGNYSWGSSGVLLPYIVGAAEGLFSGSTSWSSITQNTDLIVAFGGLPAKNAGVSSGGVGRHDMVGHLRTIRRRGGRLVVVSPQRDDMPGAHAADWWPVTPGSDGALMLGLAHELARSKRHDVQFLNEYCVGYQAFEDYLLGVPDGCPKTPHWAQSVTGIPAESIVALAHEMATGRTLITTTWSLQRGTHGEQAVWLSITLAAMLGQIGLPGGGFGHGYSSSAYIGHQQVVTKLPSLPQGVNPVADKIPVARVADMLLNPGGDFKFAGRGCTYPDIRLVYWCGGNVFHHHQDLRRLRRAIARPDTVIVHDPFWTSSARHADIVVPSTMSLERDDFGTGRNDSSLFAMPQVCEPYGAARNDYDTFLALAERLDVAPEFGQNRNVHQWLEALYDEWRDELRSNESLDVQDVPTYRQFVGQGTMRIPAVGGDQVMLAEFRKDPVGRPLSTASGKIEIFCETIAELETRDSMGYPTWIPPQEWVTGSERRSTPFHLVANQPRSRLHSQLDVGALSQSTKVQGREPLSINSSDAAELGLRAGDVVRVSNARGSCLAGLVTTRNIKRGVVQLSTGAWYDPDAEGNCIHGNPNVLMSDLATSELTQGCSGAHTMVGIEKVSGDLPSITVGRPPMTTTRSTEDR